MISNIQREDDMNIECDHEQANECFVLFEARNRLIILMRNMLRGEEFLLMTTNLAALKSSHGLWCTTAKDSELLPHRTIIENYINHKGHGDLFEAFFNMSINQFFARIS